MNVYVCEYSMYVGEYSMYVGNNGSRVCLMMLPEVTRGNPPRSPEDNQSLSRWIRIVF